MYLYVVVVSKYDSSNLKNEKSMAGLCIYEFFDVFPFPLPMGLSKAPPYNLKIYTGYYYYHMVFLQTGKSVVAYAYFVISVYHDNFYSTDLTSNTVLTKLRSAFKLETPAMSQKYAILLSNLCTRKRIEFHFLRS